MDTDRNRRYARLLTLARSPDEPMKAWMWWVCQTLDGYIGAMRYMKQQGLSTVADLQLHNQAKETL